MILILSNCSNGSDSGSESGTKATKPNTVTVKPRVGGKGFTSDSGILPEAPLIGKDGGGKNCWLYTWLEVI